MEGEKIRILLIEDNPGDARLIRELLTAKESTSFEFEHLDRLSTGLARLAQGGVDVILLDLSLPDSHGLEGLNRICAQAPKVPVVVLSGLSDEAVAINAVQEGAQDYLVKGSVDSALLVRSLRYAIERQHLRVALRESESRYRLLADNAADLIWTANMKWRITYVSPSIKRMLGYTVEEMMRLAITDILTPDSLKQASKFIRNQMDIMTPESQSPPLSLTLEHVRKDGSTLWAEVVLSFVWDKDGKLSEVLGVTREITERKKAEEALRQSEQRYRLLAENMKDIIWTRDMDLKLTYTSPSVLEMSGYSVEEVMSMSMEESLTPASLELIRPVLDKVLSVAEKGQGDLPEVIVLDVELIHKDGSITPVEMKVNLLRDSAGRPTGFLGVTRDITERKKAEEALRESQEELQAIFDSSMNGIALLDPEGRLIRVNKRVLEVGGYDTEELSGKPLDLLQMFTPESIERMASARDMILSGKEVTAFECEVCTKSGTKMSLEINVGPFLLKGQLFGLVAVIRDVTERRKAEIAFRESETRFRTVFEGTGLGIALVDFNAKTLSINPAFERMLGYNLEEFRQLEGNLKYLHPDDAMVDAKLYLEMVKGKREHYTVDKRYIRKDGGVIWGRQNLSVVRDASGKPKYFIAMIEDITARKKMEEALQQSEERYRELFENANDSIYTHDLAGNFTSINKAAELVTGYTRDEVIGMNIARILTPESIERARQMIARKVSDGGQTRYELEIVTKDGHKVLLEVNTRLIYEGGKPVGTQGIARDITERKKMEEELRESEEKLRRYLESSPDAIYINDEKGTFLYGNLVAERMIGYSKEELIGHSFLELNILPPEYLGRAIQTLELNLAGKPTGPDEFELVRKDGSRIFVEISTYPTTHDDKIEVIGIARDITERKKMEEELQRLSDAVRMSTDSIVITDLEGNVIDVNEATLKIQGTDNKENLSKLRMSDFIVPEEQEKALGDLSQVIEEGRVNDIQYHILTRDGRRVLVETNASLMRGRNGAPVGVVAVTRDVTERRKMEEELRLLSDAVKMSKDSIVISDLEGRIIEANEATLKMHSMDNREDLIGRLALELIATEDHEMLTEKMTKGMVSGGLTCVEYHCATKDGRKLLVEANVSVMKDRSGEPIGYMAVVRDITERKQMEEALRESEEKYRLYFENASDVIYSLDPEGTIMSMSPVVEKMLGYKPEELIGKNIFESNLQTSETTEKALFNISRVLAGEHGLPTEGEFIAKDGTRIFGEISGAPIFSSDGKVIAIVCVGRDITERKRMEEEVRHLSDAVRMSAESIFVADLEGRVVDANESAAKMFAAIDKSDLLGKGVLELIAPEDHEKAFENIKKVLEGEKVNPEEYRIVRKDGGRNLSELSASVLMGGDGKPTGFVAVGHDITERKRMEDALRQSEQDYRTLFDTTIDGMAVIDAETMRVLLINQPIVQKYGSGLPEDIFKGNLLDFVHPEDRERALKLIVEDLFEKDARELVKIRLINSDGKMFWASCTGARIQYQGRPAGLVSLRDITEQEEAENALRQSEQNYRVLFESTIDGMFVTDAETMRVLLANQNAAKMCGFASAENAIGINPLDLVHPDDREQVVGFLMEDAFGEGEQEVHEFRAITKDGREIWVSGMGTGIKYGGKPAVLSSIRDITERKRAEEQRKRMEEQLRLASRLAAVGELAAGVGHELNNPIAAIQGFAQFLAARKDLDETTRKDLDTIYRESQRAAKITRNLLSFARRHEPEKHLISINEAIEKTMELQAHPMKVNNIELVAELAPDLPKTLADFHQMQQVFVNIINNAEQAMVEAHGKGRLVVRTQKVRDMIQISFVDDGPGISEENIKRIFDPFFTTKEVGKGTGLGLSICYGLVEAHGGRIYARSKLGQGATFVVEIPIVFEDRLVAEAALINPGSRSAKWKKPKGQY